MMKLDPIVEDILLRLNKKDAMLVRGYITGLANPTMSGLATLSGRAGDMQFLNGSQRGQRDAVKLRINHNV